ncbi:hypothetical protein WECO103172_06325 [Weissella confusa]
MGDILLYMNWKKILYLLLISFGINALLFLTASSSLQMSWASRINFALHRIFLSEISYASFFWIFWVVLLVYALIDRFLLTEIAIGSAILVLLTTEFLIIKMRGESIVFADLNELKSIPELISMIPIAVAATSFVVLTVIVVGTVFVYIHLRKKWNLAIYF